MKAVRNTFSRDFFLLFKNGDDHAFSYFYKSFFNEMYSYGMSLESDAELTKDIIQDIFYKIYFDRQKFVSQEHLKFYLLKSVRNAIFDRNRTPGSPGPDKFGEFNITTTVLDNLIDEENRLALQQRIDKLLTTLTDRQREIIYLRYMKEMDYEEIAAMLGITVKGARKLVSRALGRLKEAGTIELTMSLLAAYRLLNN